MIAQLITAAITLAIAAGCGFWAVVYLGDQFRK